MEREGESDITNSPHTFATPTTLRLKVGLLGLGKQLLQATSYIPNQAPSPGNITEPPVLSGASHLER